MRLSVILDHIDSGHMALPEFQRGYVWNRNQVRGLMSSLYRGYPVGSFLTWVTATEEANTRGDGALAPGVVKLLLDGQQRVTSLYGIIRGRPPRFFDGNEQAFTGLRFHALDEAFEFYAPTRMDEDPIWIDVSTVMREGLTPYLREMSEHPSFSEIIDNLNRLHTIRDRDFHIEEVTGDDLTVDVVVDIFNRVNSGGTKLSKGDLALARICATWPEARQELRSRLDGWGEHGYNFQLDWLLRNVTTILTGSAFFSGLRDTTAEVFATGLQRAERSVSQMLNLLAGRLGLDHDRVLGARYAFPVAVRYLDDHAGPLGAAEQGKLLYWYVHASLWGRYTGSTESTINQDLTALHEDGLDGLLDRLRHWRGDLTIRPEDFSGWSLGARFYPMLYLMTRYRAAQDLGTGIPLSANLLGRLSRLEVHHLFPKALLYEMGYERSEVNAVANFCLLSQETNLRISRRSPADYLPEIREQHPGALESQWIPTDPELWRPENYRAFLQARRQLLAADANAILEELRGGVPAAVEADEDPTAAMRARVDVVDPEQDGRLDELNAWLRDNGFQSAEREYLVTRPDTGEDVTVVDAAWPSGMRGGYSEPVALLLEPDEETERALGAVGYRFFTSIDQLRDWLERTGGLEEPDAGS